MGMITIKIRPTCMNKKDKTVKRKEKGNWEGGRVCLFLLNTVLEQAPKFFELFFSCSVVSNSLRPHGLQYARFSWSLFKFMSIELVMPSNHLIFCCPLFLLGSIFPNIKISSNESALCIRWPKCQNFSFSISPSNEYLGLIPFRLSLSLQKERTICVDGGGGDQLEPDQKVMITLVASTWKLSWVKISGGVGEIPSCEHGLPFGNAQLN